MATKRGGSPLSNDNDLDTDYAQPDFRAPPVREINPIGGALENKKRPDTTSLESRFDSGVSSMTPTSFSSTGNLDSIPSTDVDMSTLSNRGCKTSLGDEGIGSITDDLKSDSKVKENKASLKVAIEGKIIVESMQKLSVQDPGKDDGYHSIRYASSGSDGGNINEFDEFEEILSEIDEDGDTLIHTAIVSREEWVAIAMINLLPLHSRCINIVNKLLQTALHLAVLTEQRKIVQKLVSKGCDLTMRDQQGNTPLHIACRKGSEKLVKDMVGSLADNPSKRRELFSIRNCEGLTCLHLAAQRKHYEIMGYLFARGADVNIGDAKSGRTILHYAVERKDVETVVVLLTHPSIDIDCETYKGETPLLLAYWRNYQDIVKRLKANGAYFSYDLVENDDEGDDS